MAKIVTKTVGVLSRFGERLERRLSMDGDDSIGLERSGSGYMFDNGESAFQRPFDGHNGKKDYYSPKQRDTIYGGARNSSSDNLAAAPSGSSNFNNYRQNPAMNPYSDGMGRSPYGTGIGGPLNYGYPGAYGGSSAGEQFRAGSPSFGQYGAGLYGGGAGQYGGGGAGQYGGGVEQYGGGAGQYGGGAGQYGGGAGQYGGGGSVGYAPDYYVAERRQLELVPAPPPRYIRQPVPVPVPVDRPVPQPYPVEVPRPVPVDRPYPVAVPTPVYIDRPVAVPVPVPSPPPSPVMIENSVTHTQRWVTGSPDIMSQQRAMAGSPVMMNQQRAMAGSPVMMNQQRAMAGSPIMMNQQRAMAGSPVMMNPQQYMGGSSGMYMDPCAFYGNGSYYR